MADELVYDAWTPLSFKRAMGNRRAPGVNWLAPTWVGDHARRLQAYKLLQAYLDNAGRVFLATDDEAERERHREYGDAALVRDTILAALLGSDVEVVVDGADDYDPEADGEVDGGTDDPEGDADQAEARAAWEYQEWLRDLYLEKERGRLKLLETERNAVGLGDGVYTLGYSAEKRRVRIRCWDPGFYFPVLDDGNEDDYPRTVHIAWELPPDEQHPGRIQVRRLTWRMGPIQGVVDPTSRIPTVTAGPGDTTEADGRISRRYEWNDEPTYETCYFSDGTWTIDQLPKLGVADLEEGAAVYTSRDVDLRIDFLPVVHVPNTVAVLNHYGQSSISRVMQILDDLANTDTDLQGAAATAGQPILALEGGTLGNSRARYSPGEVWETGGGKLHWLTTEGALTGLGELSDRLYSRLAMVSRIPEGLLGRIKASEVPSGIALALSFGPLSSLMAEMRLARAEKYPLLFRFAWRMSRAAQVPDAPERFFDARLQLGSFLPSDRGSIVTEVAALLTAGAISRLTAVRLLMAAGLEIDDANEEVDRIEAGDFAGAGELLDVLGDIAEVRRYLKREESATPRELPPDNPPPAVDPATGLPIDPATGLPALA